ncbi:hypothetical protein VHEMI08326 [[Torrubiella] hemipterigena]|uniref:BZIP transcription factor n=1 Tax=[Torrubiella] hemipterigena TaxID=1531966 RepID=A0A0A1TPK3_9HYPO|nr:hypothetical protein VHEMI08326 [[Torrubiella] hemipterigena]
MSATGDEDGRRPKRVRTTEQLQRKRESDRVKHKINRAESKTRLEHIEQEVITTRKNVDELMAVLELLRANPLVSGLLGLNSPSSSAANTPGSTANAKSPASALSKAGLPVRASTQTRSVVRPTSRVDKPSSTTKKPAPSSRNNRNTNPKAWPVHQHENGMYSKCYCGIEHPNGDMNLCIESVSLDFLFRAQQRLAEDPTSGINLRLNLTLNEYLMIQGDNIVSALIVKVMKQFEFPSQPSAFGWLFICYRLARWRLNPTAENFQGVPECVYPTNLQNSVPHPMSLTALPWAQLRDYIIQDQNNDYRRDIQMIISSSTLMWPDNKPLICRDVGSGYKVHPDFEQFASKECNWRLAGRFRELFPHLDYIAPWHGPE